MYARLKEGARPQQQDTTPNLAKWETKIMEMNKDVSKIDKML